ncbi:aldehyde dehydrogenase family protein [Methylobacterium sp. WSM2598]|uniref:aldehyde dehydrogenase family protein n=1 Tax=Methylobacterium sp. WSM2598 TaxID=398261 RepID=UPI003FA57D9E
MHETGSTYWRRTSRRGRFGGKIIFDPATEQSLGTLLHAGTAELDRALMAASRAFALETHVAFERGQILRRVADLMREWLDHVATVLTLPVCRRR